MNEVQSNMLMVCLFVCLYGVQRHISTTRLLKPRNSSNGVKKSFLKMRLMKHTVKVGSKTYSLKAE